MKKLAFLALAMVFIMASCSSDQAVRYVVASKSIDCEGVAPQKCLLVKKGEDKTWTMFYSSIEGFNYEEGYEYELDVKEEALTNVPADVSAIKYTLAKEVSKVQKESEGMPVTKKDFVWRGKVISVETKTLGRGAAEGQFPVTVVTLNITNSNEKELYPGNPIACELIAEPTVKEPKVDVEYIFESTGGIHPGRDDIYMLDTNVKEYVKKK